MSLSYTLFFYSFFANAEYLYNQSQNWMQFELNLPDSSEDYLVQINKTFNSEPLLLLGNFYEYPYFFYDNKKADWKIKAQFNDFQSWATMSNLNSRLIIRHPHPASIFLGVFKNSADLIHYSISLSVIPKNECFYTCQNSSCSKYSCNCSIFEELGNDCTVKSQEISLKTRKSLRFDRFDWKFFRVDSHLSNINLEIASHHPRLRIFQYSADDSSALPGFFNYDSQYFLMTRVESLKVNFKSSNKKFWLFGIFCENFEPCDLSISVSHSSSSSSTNLQLIVAVVLSLFILCITVPIVIKLVSRFRRARNRFKTSSASELVKKKQFDKFYPTVRCQHLENDSPCPICLEEIKFQSGIKVLQCLHIFHSNCISEWYLSKAFCPLCKQQISQDDTLVVRDI